MNDGFGELLRHCRTRRGITQRQLADLATVSVRAIRDIELGRVSRPRPGTVELIADGLGLTGRSREHFAAAGRAAPVCAPRSAEGWTVPPASWDELVGRESESAVLVDLLTRGEQRLVTITGLPMAGKTRTAIEVANLLDAAGDLPVRWRSARRGPPEGTQEEDMRAGSGEFGGLAGEHAAQDEPALLVLDGYEPSPSRLAALVALLHDYRRLRVLITSRTSFDVPGETVFPLRPLGVPERGTCHDAVPAVRLLTRHVRQVRPDLRLDAANARVTAELCRLLDGLPAPIEAAAAWLLVYDPGSLLRRIQADPLSFQSGPCGDADIRRLLTDVLDALDPAETALLDRLARLDRGWSVEEAVAMTGLPVVRCALLVRRLLVRGVVRPVTEDGARFEVLGLVRLLSAERSRAGTAPLGVAVSSRHRGLPERPRRLAGSADARR